MKKKAIVLIFTAVTAAMIFLSGCGQKIGEYSAEDYVGVEISGTDGSGKAKAAFNRSGFYDKLNRDLFDGNASDEELAAMEFACYNWVKINVEGKTENLSNGDTLTITVTADNDKLKDYRMRFSDKPYVYTVSGLTDASQTDGSEGIFAENEEYDSTSTVVDVFDGVSIEYEGVSPHASAKVVYEGPYKDDVYYTLDNKVELKIGDVITVKARANNSRFTDENLVPTATEKQFTVEGIDKYADEADVDYSELDKFFQEKMDETMKEGSAYTKGWESDAGAFFKDGSSQEKWKVNSCEYAPVKKGIIIPDSNIGKYNSYLVFWRLSLEIEKINDTDGSEYKKGDTASSEIYTCTYISNIIARTDGSLSYDTEEYDMKIYATNDWFSFDNYVGADLDEVFEARTGDEYIEHEWIEVE